MNQLPDPKIILADGPCIVLNKPGGLLTQAPPGIDSLEARVKQFIARRDGKSGKVYLGVPHRLDRPVSGVMVVARHVRAARKLAEQFQNRTVRKKYWAVVEGIVESATGTWQDHLRKIPGEAKSEIVSADRQDAQLANLNYRILARGDGKSLLEIELGTGRTHQIRLQAASRGWPILGDELYGGRQKFGPQPTDIRKKWIALHARQLEFVHPMKREPISISAPVSEYWYELNEFSFDD